MKYIRLDWIAVDCSRLVRRIFKPLQTRLDVLFSSSLHSPFIFSTFSFHLFFLTFSFHLFYFLLSSFLPSPFIFSTFSFHLFYLLLWSFLPSPFIFSTLSFHLLYLLLWSSLPYLKIVHRKNKLIGIKWILK